MDKRTGDIYDLDPKKIKVLLKKSPGMKKFLQKMEILPTHKQLFRNPACVGRNEPCPCKSGKKFKKCCLVSV